MDMFKALADEKKTVTDEDIEALINNEIYKPDPVWELLSVHVTAGDRVAPTATVCMAHQDGTEITKSDIGTGAHPLGLPQKMPEALLSHVMLQGPWTRSTRPSGSSRGVR